MAKNPHCHFLRKRNFPANCTPTPEEPDLCAVPLPRKRKRTAKSIYPKADLQPKIVYTTSALTTDSHTGRNQALVRAVSIEKSAFPCPNMQISTPKASVSRISVKDLASDFLQVCSSQLPMTTEEIVAALAQKQPWGNCGIPNLTRQVRNLTNVFLAVGVIGERGEGLCLQKSGNSLLTAKIAQKRVAVTHLCAQFMAIQQLIRRNFTTPACARDSIPLPLLVLATEDCAGNNICISGDPAGRQLSVKSLFPFKLLSEGDVLLRLALPPCSPTLTAQLLPHPDLQLYLSTS